jgi:hypothetical protein
LFILGQIIEEVLRLPDAFDVPKGPILEDGHV